MESYISPGISPPAIASYRESVRGRVRERGLQEALNLKPQRKQKQSYRLLGLAGQPQGN